MDPEVKEANDRMLAASVEKMTNAGAVDPEAMSAGAAIVSDQSVKKGD